MSPVPFADFVVRSINLCKPPRRRPATQTKLAQVLREFAQVCDSTADISLDAVAAWLDLHPSRAPLTSFSLLRSFARAVKLASKQGMIPVNPFDIIPPSQWFPTGALDTPEKVRHLTVDQIGRLLARASLEAQGGDWEALRLEWLVKVYAFTGCRKNEALGLLTADVDLAEEVIWIPAESAASAQDEGVAATAAHVPRTEGRGRILGRAVQLGVGGPAQAARRPLAVGQAGHQAARSGEGAGRQGRRSQRDNSLDPTRVCHGSGTGWVQRTPAPAIPRPPPAPYSIRLSA